jgi:hypothetical protein
VKLVNLISACSSHKMVRGILVLRAIVIVVEPLPLGDVPVGHQQDPALAVDVIPHALEVLLLPPLPATSSKQRIPSSLMSHSQVQFT